MRAPASLLLHRTAAAAGNGMSSSAAPRSTLEEQQQGQHQTDAPVAMAVNSMAVNSNMVVILASLLCALVCVLGLALVSRCACRRRRSASSSGSSSSDPPPKGLKKKAIDALPTVSFASATALPESSSSTSWSSSSECAICLAEFVDGEGLRVLPRCGHGFHVACVDAWLRTCASCPSCRAAIVDVERTKPVPVPATPTLVVVVASGGDRCQRCGELAAPAGDRDATFLP